MTDIISSEDCSNLPKQKLVEDITVAMQKKDMAAEPRWSNVFGVRFTPDDKIYE